MNIISWNVNGIRAIVKKDFFNAVKKMNPDILCLQETKAQDEDTHKALKPLAEKYHIWCNSAEKKGYSGTAILSKSLPVSIVNDMEIAEHDNEGRVMCLEFSNFYLVNVYVPNSGQGLKRLDYRKRWDKDFLNYIKELQKIKSVVVCGDFNVAHQAIDLKNDKSNYNKTAGYTQTEIDGMTNFINSGFVDAFRYFHTDVIAYSYWSYRFNARARNTGWRIDYFLVNRSLIDNIKSIEILSEVLGSDHCPIQLEIET